MNILVVDNTTSYLPQLKNLLSKENFSVVSYSDLKNTPTDEFDAIILSGGHQFSVEGNQNRFEKEISLIQNTQKPILGICLGFELISYAFGAKLELLQNKERGIIDIMVIKPDNIFSNTPNFQVYESHRWVVKEAPDDLVALARSKDGIEAVKHKSRPIYGVQFHPEMFVEKTCGDEIFFNFLNIIIKNNFI